MGWVHPMTGCADDAGKATDVEVGGLTSLAGRQGACWWGGRIRLHCGRAG